MRTTRRIGTYRNLRQRGERGAELVEMAFALPILLTLLLGIIWFARAYNIYETMTRAAREGARVAAGPACSACSGGGQLASIGRVASAARSLPGASHVAPAQAGCGSGTRPCMRSS